MCVLATCVYCLIAYGQVVDCTCCLCGAARLLRSRGAWEGSTRTLNALARVRLRVGEVGVVHHEDFSFIILQVIDGFQVVKAMEAVGSSSGDTAFDVIIAHCGKSDGAGTISDFFWLRAIVYAIA